VLPPNFRSGERGGVYGYIYGFVYICNHALCSYHTCECIKKIAVLP